MAETGAQLDAFLVQRFNADARPLSVEALEALRSYLVDHSADEREQAVQAVLARLTAGVQPTLNTACKHW